MVVAGELDRSWVLQFSSLTGTPIDLFSSTNKRQENYDMDDAQKNHKMHGGPENISEHDAERLALGPLEWCLGKRSGSTSIMGSSSS